MSGHERGGGGEQRQPGIAAVGAYIPRFRLSADAVRNALGAFHARGVESVAVPDADEDALTMAAEAGRRALAASDYDAGDVDSLFLASTTLPYDEEAGTGRLASLLGVENDARTAQFSGSTAAGGEALAASLDGASVPGEGDGDTSGVALVVASDCPQGATDESVGHAAGAGAAAVVLAPGGAGEVTERGSYNAAYPGTRFRERGNEETTGLDVTSYDRQAYRETVAGAVEDLGLEDDVAGPEAAALQAPDGDLPYRAGRSLDIDAETVAAGTAVSEIGDTGAASALLGFADAVDTGYENVLVVSYGSGGAAHAFRVTIDGRVPARVTLSGDRDLDFAGAQRRRGAFDSGVPEGGGAYVSVPSYHRTLPQRHRLVAGRCRNCGALRFPPEGACVECGKRPGYDDAQLSETGTVEVVTTISQGGAPPEFVPQQARAGDYASAVVAFEGREGGGEVSVPVQVVLVGDDAPEIGDKVVARPRLLYEQEGVRRYGVKGVPASDRRE
ncbi:zinc ribbon domain-containing protein [Halobacterium zhouii]|uniref:zinc ribbon domain-containing protein n=1 Tax=Halobacterium zhouii TaxID=2902624 RepID=UPI001E4E0A16|nr:zinc ribbon domain-containing protein [Halobacterium zhouii]